MRGFGFTSTLAESSCSAGALVLTARLRSQYAGVGENMLFLGNGGLRHSELTLSSVKLTVVLMEEPELDQD